MFSLDAKIKYSVVYEILKKHSFKVCYGSVYDVCSLLEQENSFKFIFPVSSNIKAQLLSKSRLFF